MLEPYDLYRHDTFGVHDGVYEPLGIEYGIE